MVGKIKRGKSFKGVCKYVLNPDKKVQPKIIGGNMASETPAELANEFEIFAAINPRVQMTVKHFSLAFAPEDGDVSDEVKFSLADRYMVEMGYGNSQYLVVSHSRSDHNHKHDHLHIVANAVAMDGKWVNDRLDWKRSQTILRDLERQFELTQVVSSWDKNRDKSKATSKDRREERLLGNGMQASEIDRTRDLIQVNIDSAALAPTISEFCARLQSLGVETIPRITRKGRVQGFSYKLGEIVTRGSDLDNASFPTLQSARGIGYDAHRDLVNLRKIARGEKLEVEPDERWEIRIDLKSSEFDRPIPESSIEIQSELRVKIKVEGSQQQEEKERESDRSR